MSVLSKSYFSDEAAAFEHVEAILWPIQQGNFRRLG